MSRTRLQSRHLADTRDRTTKMRRRASKPLSTLCTVALVQAGPAELEGEYGPTPRTMRFRTGRRRLGLASDIFLLTIASPFFIIWWVYRAVRQIGQTLAVARGIKARRA